MDSLPVDGFKPENILTTAAQLTKIAKGDLEIHNEKEGAVAIAIFVTLDRNGGEVKGGHTVTFSDDEWTLVGTGQYAGQYSGVRVFTVPERGVFRGSADVDYIRKKKK